MTTWGATRLTPEETLAVPREWDGGYHWDPADVARAQHAKFAEVVMPLFKEALDDNCWHAKGCPGDACVWWVGKSRALVEAWEKGA